MILGLEKPRKDWYELVGHHAVTVALAGGSYWFHFTHMGIGVFITHDISDFFFAVCHSPHFLSTQSLKELKLIDDG